MNNAHTNLKAERMADELLQRCIDEGMLNSTVQHLKNTTSFHKVAVKGILLGLESHGECVHRDEAAKTCHDAFEQGKQQMKEILKERGYWEEGEGKERIYYMIEEREYPHDLGCEGSMCWCMSRRKKELSTPKNQETKEEK